MKQKITLLSFLFFIMLFSFGQMKELKGNQHYEKFRRVSQSIVLNRVNIVQNKISLFIKSKEVFQNSNINLSKWISSPLVTKYGLDHEISQTWDESSNQLVDDWKTEYTYDIKGKQTENIVFYWDVSQWMKAAKTECDYDNDGNLIQIIDYGWSGSEWIVGEKTEYTYDVNENLIQYILYYWNEMANQWVSSRKTEYTYDTTGNLTQYIDYVMGGGDQWLTELKTEYTYDINDYLSQYVQYIGWGGGAWDNYMKTEYTYNIHGKLTQCIVNWWYGNQWYTSDKTEYTFDINGDLSHYVDYIWDGNQWNAFRKSEFTYNDSYSFADLVLPFFYKYSDFKIVYDHQLLNDGIGKIFDIGEMFFNHMMTNRTKYEWDETLNDWAITNNYAFSFSEQDILSVSKNNLKQLKIHPNPVSNILVIKSDINPIENVEIYSVLGKKIKEIHSDFNNIHTEDLSKGVYLLRIYTEKGAVVKKLIKN